MGETVSVIKTLAIPAVISLVLFLLSTHVLMPIYRRYRTRYAQYLPLDTLSNQTSSLRGRVTRWIAARRERLMVIGGRSSLDGNDDGDISDGDEELTVVDALAMPVPMRGARGGMDTARRLSRDLEEGFRDDSDDDSDDEKTPPRR